MRDQSCMPVPADAAEAVIAAAEEAVRRAAAREEARARRKAPQQRRRAGRERKAGEQRERERAEEQRLRAEADRARTALLKRAVKLREASGGSVLGCFAGVADPRARRGRRHSLPCILALVVMAMLHGKTKLADITAWITHAEQEDLAGGSRRRRRR